MVRYRVGGSSEIITRYIQYNPVDHTFQKLFATQGEMMMPVVFVVATEPSTLNIPRPGIDSRLRG